MSRRNSFTCSGSGLYPLIFTGEESCLLSLSTVDLLCRSLKERRLLWWLSLEEAALFWIARCFRALQEFIEQVTDPFSGTLVLIKNLQDALLQRRQFFAE